MNPDHPDQGEEGDPERTIVSSIIPLSSAAADVSQVDDGEERTEVSPAVPLQGKNTGFGPADIGAESTIVSPPLTVAPSGDSEQRGEDPDRTVVALPPAIERPEASVASPQATVGSRTSPPSSLLDDEGATLVATAWVGTVPPGTILNNTYRIESFIAKGGMGEVYRAENLITGKPTAVKTIISRYADDPNYVDLMISEAAALKRIKHDAIIEYESLTRDRSGQLILAMEFVEGPSLKQILSQRKLSVEEVRALRNRLAAGLGVAHDEGIFHRDLSPDNVILPAGDVKAAKIIDFGIARNLRSEGTIIGSQFAGKPSYASPEQFGLVGGVVDGRSDIYSLGLVLAHAALGERLDMGAGRNPEEARRKVPDLSAVPKALRVELTRMLQPEPSARPASMWELIDDPAVLATAGRKITIERGGRGLRLALAAMVLAVIGLGSVVFFLQSRGPENVPEPLFAECADTDCLARAWPRFRDDIALDCVGLDLRPSGDGAVTIEGFVRRDSDIGLLESKMASAGVSRKFRVDYQVRIFEWPRCSVASVLQEIPAFRAKDLPRPKIEMNKETGIYRLGDDFFAQVTAPADFEGYLWVSYINKDGLVSHLLPSSDLPDNIVRRGQTRKVGVTANGEPYAASTPVGRSIVLAIASAVPLFKSEREDDEPALDFLRDLRSAFLEPGSREKISAHYVMLTIEE